MDVNMSSNTTSRQTPLSRNNGHPTKERLRRRLMTISRDVRKLKETTGAEATVYVAAKDNLYCVNGQRHFRDMRACVSDMNVPNDEEDISDSQTGVDQNESLWWTRPVETMGQSELERFRKSLLELRKDVDKAIAANSSGTDSRGDVSPPLSVLIQEAGGSSGDVRDGSATASVSCPYGSGLGRHRVRGA